jgi:hypothetical protein
LKNKTPRLTLMPTNIPDLHLWLYRWAMIISSFGSFAISTGLIAVAVDTPNAAPFVACGFSIAGSGALAVRKSSYWWAVVHTALVGVLVIGNLGLLIQFGRVGIVVKNPSILAGLAASVEVLAAAMFFASIRFYQALYERHGPAAALPSASASFPSVPVVVTGNNIPLQMPLARPIFVKDAPVYDSSVDIPAVYKNSI